MVDFVQKLSHQRSAQLRIYLANVGANSAHQGLFSPLFADGTFEFVPIPSYYEDSDPIVIRYRDLRSYNNRDCDLRQFVPAKLLDTACHNDPEFATFTYGDVGENGRSAALTKMTTGDALLFLARLEGWQSGRRTGQAGFYLIGGLLAAYAGWVVQHSSQEKRFANNAHPYRGDARFWGVAGSGQSRRFERAVPINRGICTQVFRDAGGRAWTWGNGRSELARIGSYTRACRCVLDTNDAEQHQRTATLRKWIEQYTGASDAALLANSRREDCDG